MMTRLKLKCRDTLYYKLFPLYLRLFELYESRIFAATQKRLPRAVAGAPAQGHLFLTHGRGGGVDKFVEHAAWLIEEQGGQAWILCYKPLLRRFVLKRRSLASKQDVMRFRFPTQYSQMIGELRALGIEKLHLHHTRYLPYYFVRNLAQFAAALQVPYDVTLHDFIAMCPRVHLVLGDFNYCGMPKDTAVCDHCVRQNGMLTVAPYDVGKWRTHYTELLNGARARIAPSRDTADLHQQILDIKDITVEPHDKLQVNLKKLPVKGTGEPYGVVVIGHLHRYKGAGVLLACAEDAGARNLPLRFTLIGDSVYRRELVHAGVNVSGVFKDYELPALLAGAQASLAFLPSVWPETYSYVLSHMLENGYFPVAFDMGAQAERIRAAQVGLTLPVALIDSPALINDALLKAAYGRHHA